MEVIKRHPTDGMKDVVVGYRGCGHREYYGMIHWRDGLQYCRRCIYEMWQKETNYKGWKPGENDYVFPYYEDGVNYFKEEPDEKENGTNS